METDTALQLWDEGQRRLRDADPVDRTQLERVTDAVVDELRRRLGGAFTTDELAALYSRGSDWVLDVAIATAPHHPNAWDAQTVGGAAFSRYVREAVDWSGGRRRTREELERQSEPLDRPMRG
ncbi:hypothetical protein [Conexibacter woesei]|uniref:Uncharacterized protein n=1 Tax=Conexibacter woesei (strain DSM 14684 / CCUG 47730 / CIP 108061 / JCM 11494 / NBRC 100937 / ID131577) TaxID=469383 RepID=D3FEF0_CONWI|nr:hypothetical protein [Conexibacter woesei]ADB53642.1 hypothetical protein Cwoe_5236 [Conexibacter woesei DSM 14684]